jgi:hypothetical protein
MRSAYTDNVQLFVDNNSIALKQLVINIQSNEQIRGYFMVEDDQRSFVIHEIFDPGKTFKIIGNPIGESPFELSSCVITSKINLLNPPSIYHFDANNQSTL